MSESILGPNFRSVSDIDQVLQGCANTNYQVTELRPNTQRSYNNNSALRLKRSNKVKSEPPNALCQAKLIYSSRSCIYGCGVQNKTRSTIPYHQLYCILNPNRDQNKNAVDGRTRVAKQTALNMAIGDFVTDALGTNSDTDVSVAQPMDQPLEEENVPVNVEQLTLQHTIDALQHQLAIANTANARLTIRNELLTINLTDIIGGDFVAIILCILALTGIVYKAVDVKGDGSCAYRSIAVADGADERDWRRYKTGLLRAYNANTAAYDHLFLTEEIRAEWRANLASPASEYANLFDITRAAFEIWLEKNVVLYSWNRNISGYYCLQSQRQYATSIYIARNGEDSVSEAAHYCALIKVE